MRDEFSLKIYTQVNSSPRTCGCNKQGYLNSIKSRLDGTVFIKVRFEKISENVEIIDKKEENIKD